MIQKDITARKVKKELTTGNTGEHWESKLLFAP
jgi:hypothetical protein